MIVRQDHLSSDALAIVQKYEEFVNYAYPIFQCSPRKHGIFRDAVLAALFEPIAALYHAARSQQVSRLHAIDAQFATLRAYLRFAARTNVRILSPHQHRVALAKLAEPGKMLGAWQKKLGGRAGK